MQLKTVSLVFYFSFFLKNIWSAWIKVTRSITNYVPVITASAHLNPVKHNLTRTGPPLGVDLGSDSQYINTS